MSDLAHTLLQRTLLGLAALFSGWIAMLFLDCCSRGLLNHGVFP